MKKFLIALVLISLPILTACQPVATPAATTEPALVPETPVAAATATIQATQASPPEPTRDPQPTNTPASTAITLAPLAIDWEKPFGNPTYLEEEPASLPTG